MFRAHRVGWRLELAFYCFRLTSKFGSKPTGWDGDTDFENFTKSGNFVLSPPRGMVTCDTSLRYCALYHCSKPIAWDGDNAEKALL